MAVWVEVWPFGVDVWLFGLADCLLNMLFFGRLITLYVTCDPLFPRIFKYLFC